MLTKPFDTNILKKVQELSDAFVFSYEMITISIF